MKLSFLLVLVSALQVSANVSGQATITLKMDKVEIPKVLNAIEKQGTYRFLYNSRLKSIQQQVSIDVSNLSIAETLTKIFAGTDLTFKMLENNLIVILLNGTATQDIPVTGKITGENGESLSGVSVIVKNGSGGTSTDNNGIFKLTVPENGVLVISYIGYQTQEVPVNSQSVIDIKMVTSNKTLDQVVVVGYGTQKKIDITGATASIKGSELVKQPVMTATQAIQGKVPGVQIISSGQPGVQPQVRIRGTGTMLGGANPLYVVDGMLTNDITNINTADILSVDILKDASSAAIYGTRGSNGVIIITTKQGSSGKMKITYNLNLGIQNAAHVVEMANNVEYANYASAASGNPILPGTISTNWYDEILRNAFYQDHKISLSGGTDKTKYIVDVGYLDQDGIILENNFKRFTLRSNNEFKISNQLRFGILASYANGVSRNVNLGAAYNDAYRAAPIIPGIVNGKYGNTSLYQNVGNPILDINDNDNRTRDNRLQGTAFLEFKPIPWLTLQSRISGDLDNNVNKAYGYAFAADTVTFITPGGNQSSLHSNLNVANANSFWWVWDNTATVNKRFGEHNITVLIGTTAEKYNATDLTGYRLDVPPNPSLWYIDNGNANSSQNGGSGTVWSRYSYLARINYSYADKYLFTGNFRVDGSSNFSVNNRYAYTPSVGVGWVISKESFMQSQHIFDVLKLRASYGQAANDVTQNATAGYTVTLTSNLPYFFGGTATSGSAITQIVDQNLKWEINDEMDIAIEFSALKSRLEGELGVYDKKTKNSLAYVLIPSTLGSQPNPGSSIPAGYVLTNAASFENKGLELALKWHDAINKNISYYVGGNITFNNNNVIGLNGGQPYIDGPVGANQPYVTRTDNGHPIGSFYVQKVLGVFQTVDEINSYTDKNGNILQPGAKPGDFKYEYNSDGKLDSVYAGSYQPTAYYGISLGMNYKNIDFSVDAYGTMGGKIYNGKKAFRQSLKDNVEKSMAYNRWTPSNHSETEPSANGGNLPASTYFVETGSYLRINNITVGYTLSPALLQKTKVISTLRIYAAAQNPVTITKYSGFTPADLPGSPTNTGIELNAYPTPRTFLIGLNIGF